MKLSEKLKMSRDPPPGNHIVPLKHREESDAERPAALDDAHKSLIISQNCAYPYEFLSQK
jgi:hypothetical protein